MNAIGNSDHYDDDRPIELPIIRRPPKKPSQSTTTQNEQQHCLKPRDPRFDSKCAGSNDVRHFVRNYAFVDDIRHDELKQLEKALRKEKNSEKKAKIKMAISRIRNKMVERNNKSKKMQVLDELKSDKSIAKGKFRNIRKSDIKKKLMITKYKELKESGKLTKYLERKRKKLINRDGKAFAFTSS